MYCVTYLYMCSTIFLISRLGLKFNSLVYVGEGGWGGGYIGLTSVLCRHSIRHHRALLFTLNTSVAIY